MKVFLYILFFNPMGVAHLHEGYAPLEIDSMERCLEVAAATTERFNTVEGEPFVIDCNEATSQYDSAKRAVDKHKST